MIDSANSDFEVSIIEALHIKHRNPNLKKQLSTQGLHFAVGLSPARKFNVAAMIADNNHKKVFIILLIYTLILLKSVKSNPWWMFKKMQITGLIIG